MTGQSEIIADDLITLVARGHGLHFTVMSLLDRIPVPSVKIVPINDMPPMAIVPAWLPTTENPAIRPFVAALAGFRRHDARAARGPA